jgi:hypothetical protein
MSTICCGLAKAAWCSKEAAAMAGGRRGGEEDSEVFEVHVFPGVLVEK